MIQCIASGVVVALMFLFIYRGVDWINGSERTINYINTHGVGLYRTGLGCLAMVLLSGGLWLHHEVSHHKRQVSAKSLDAVMGELGTKFSQRLHGR